MRLRCHRISSSRRLRGSRSVYLRRRSIRSSPRRRSFSLRLRANRRDSRSSCPRLRRSLRRSPTRSLSASTVRSNCSSPVRALAAARVTRASRRRPALRGTPSRSPHSPACRLGSPNNRVCKKSHKKISKPTPLQRIIRGFSPL